MTAAPTHLSVARFKARALALCLRPQRFRYANEYDLQAGIAQVLGAEGHAFEREVTLGTLASRIDFVVRSSTITGIEVKVGGSFADLVRQLQRYAITKQVDALLVVSTKATHGQLPETIGDVPVEVLIIGGLR